MTNSVPTLLIYQCTWTLRLLSHINVSLLTLGTSDLSFSYLGLNTIFFLQQKRENKCGFWSLIKKRPNLPRSPHLFRNRKKPGVGVKIPTLWPCYDLNELCPLFWLHPHLRKPGDLSFHKSLCFPQMNICSVGLSTASLRSVNSEAVMNLRVCGGMQMRPPTASASQTGSQGHHRCLLSFLQ